MSQLPLPDAYQRVVLTPALCFSDTELKGGTIHTNARGLPMPWSGQFATVFRLQTPGGTRAVRCFTGRISDHQERYARLQQHTRGLPLPMLAAFEYQPNGIRVNGAWHPIVKMEWVNGVKLDDYVEALVRQKNTRGLNELATQWAALTQSLRQHQIAHGDLQHENILVSQGVIRLVDYDGAFVPGLAGKAALELGHPHYQHPRRAATDFNLEMDNFSALVIYLSLKALAIEPGLWQQFHTDKHLLLRAEDFKSPAAAPAIAALQHSHDAEVRALTATLTTACTAPVASVPALEALLISSVTPRTRPAQIQSTPKTIVHRWYLRNKSAWLVLGMGVVTALLIAEPWMVALGVIGYLLVLLFESATRDVPPAAQARYAALEIQNQQLTQEVAALKGELKRLQPKP